MTMNMYQEQIRDLLAMYEEGWLTIDQYRYIAGRITEIAIKAGLFF